MTTLAVDKPRPYELGYRSDIPVITSDIIYEGAAVGVVAASGHARPLVAGDVFAGFAAAKADNSAGAAAAINVHVVTRGRIQLPVTGAVITDVGAPVYATDDNAFGLTPVGGTFIGFVSRFVSAGIAIVEFDAYTMVDPWANYTNREAITGAKTLDAEDNGKLFGVTAAADGATITLPAIAAGLSDIVILSVGAFGTTAIIVDLDNADLWLGPDISATSGDGKTLTLTKATQRRGDLMVINGPEADGYMIRLKGTWARET